MRVSSGHSKGRNQGQPDRRAKNLDFRQVLARPSGLGNEIPNTRAKSSAFSPILSRLPGLSCKE
ncbi:hypothetical protein CYL77_14865 [Corynebacterium glutamicum]|nr:hypothetical protein B7P23_13800 [Corynebacterium glutamicum]AUI02308.1 hypothetical protein CYL77_14865 [Corynebacterium glutamicum]AUI03126.1 hypothetical protein C0I99_02865 [Corynebacterium glutamicum]